MTLEPAPSLHSEMTSNGDNSDAVWNMGAELADINIRVRKVFNEPDNTRAGSQYTLLDDILNLDQKFQQWEDHIYSERTPYTVEADPNYSTRLVYIFDSDHTGYSFSYYWGFRLWLAEIGTRLIDSMLITPQTLLPQHEVISSEHLSSHVDHFSNVRHTHAYHLVHGSQFALLPSAGLHGAHRISFAILFAMYVFVLDQDSNGIRQASDAIRRLTYEKGLGVASIALKNMALHMTGNHAKFLEMLLPRNYV
jgi:hypothetical protein